MNDPHIDIDEVENYQPPKPAEEIPAAQASTTPPSPNPASQTFDDDFDEERMTGGSTFGDIFSSMSQQFRRWQDQAGSGGDSEFIPKETRRHLRASQRELLLAWRSLIDYSLERIDRRDVRDQIRREAEMSDDTEPVSNSSKIVVEEVED